MSVRHGDLVLRLGYANDGYAGRFDPDDPDDQRLLRFWVERDRVRGQTEVLATACTLIPLRTARRIRERLAQLLLQSLIEHSPEAYQTACEQLAWCSPDWLAEAA